VSRTPGASALRPVALAIVLTVIGASLLALAIGWQANRMLAARTLADLDAVLADIVRDRPTSAAIATDVTERGRRAGPWRVGLVDRELRPVAGDIPADIVAALIAGATIMRRPDADGQDRLVAARMHVIPDGATLIALRVIDDEQRLGRAIQATVALGTLLLALVAFTIGWRAQRRLQSRIAGITAATDAIMDGRLGERVLRDHSGDEIDQLSARLNAMLTRIESLVYAIRDLSDNIAHDLKTPLSRLRMTADRALTADAAGAHDGLTRVIEEADDLIAVFNAMLLIARLERDAVAQHMDVIDASAIVADAAELYTPAAEDAGFVLTTQLSSGAFVRANRQLLAQAIANLVDNAIKYGRPLTPGVDAVIALTVTRAADTVDISVSDRGAGIPDADRARVLERFVRLEASRSAPGTGLGLSLVAAIVRLHRGTLDLSDNAPGLCITVRLDSVL
jgi:signal transduction histidine kinase